MVHWATQEFRRWTALSIPTELYGNWVLGQLSSRANWVLGLSSMTTEFYGGCSNFYDNRVLCQLCSILTEFYDNWVQGSWVLWQLSSMATEFYDNWVLWQLSIAIIWRHVMKWKHFSCYWSFVTRIHPSLVDSLHKGPACVFPLMYASANG